MIRLKTLKLIRSTEELAALPDGKLLINTINAHSYNTARKDEMFADALRKGDALIPDGMSIVKACRLIKADYIPIERIAGWDLFSLEMTRLNNSGGKVMFVGSNDNVLGMIKERAAKDFPNLEVRTYSPPYKAVFSEEDNNAIIDAINNSSPNLLWIGMTAPKQEKWIYQNWDALNINCHCGTVGAVFDFYAGTKDRAPLFWQKHGIEWLYRLIKEPRRMWRRYIIGNILFIFYIAHEKIEAL